MLFQVNAERVPRPVWRFCEVAYRNGGRVERGTHNTSCYRFDRPMFL
jgi:hypothetical protein